MRIEGVRREVPYCGSEIVQVILQAINSRPFLFPKVREAHTLLGPEGPTEIHIRSASVSSGSEPTFAEIKNLHSRVRGSLTERAIVGAPDIALRRH